MPVADGFRTPQPEDELADDGRRDQACLANIAQRRTAAKHGPVAFSQEPFEAPQDGLFSKATSSRMLALGS